jgi:hypothetical protein
VSDSQGLYVNDLSYATFTPLQALAFGLEKFASEATNIAFGTAADN